MKLIALSRFGVARHIGEAMLCTHSNSFPHFKEYLLRILKEGGKWKGVDSWDANVHRCCCHLEGLLVRKQQLVEVPGLPADPFRGVELLRMPPG